MNQDDIANDAIDAKLSRLFAEKNEPLAANEFMTKLLPRLERTYRVQQMRRVLMLVAVLFLAAFITPLAARTTMRLFSIAGSIEVTPATNALLTASMLVVTLGVFLWSRKRIRQI